MSLKPISDLLSDLRQRNSLIEQVHKFPPRGDVARLSDAKLKLASTQAEIQDLMQRGQPLDPHHHEKAGTAYAAVRDAHAAMRDKLAALAKGQKRGDPFHDMAKRGAAAHDREAREHGKAAIVYLDRLLKGEPPEAAPQEEPVPQNLPPEEAQPSEGPPPGDAQPPEEMPPEGVSTEPSQSKGEKEFSKENKRRALVTVKRNKAGHVAIKFF